MEGIVGFVGSVFGVCIAWLIRNEHRISSLEAETIAIKNRLDEIFQEKISGKHESQ